MRFCRRTSSIVILDSSGDSQGLLTPSNLIILEAVQSVHHSCIIHLLTSYSYLTNQGAGLYYVDVVHKTKRSCHAKCSLVYHQFFIKN